MVSRIRATVSVSGCDCVFSAAPAISGRSQLPSSRIGSCVNVFLIITLFASRMIIGRSGKDCDGVLDKTQRVVIGKMKLRSRFQSTHVSRETSENVLTVTIRIPAAMRTLTGARQRLESAGSDVRACIDDLDARHPGVKERIVDDSGEVRRFINVYVNGEDIRHLAGLHTPVKDGDEVSIVPVVAGG